MFVWKHSSNDWWLLQCTARLQLASKVAKLVDRASATACNKQIDCRCLRPSPHYGQGGGLHTAGVLMLSAVDERPSGGRTCMNDWTWTSRYVLMNLEVHGLGGLVCSLCVIRHHQLREMRARGGVNAVMRSEMHWTKLTGTDAGYALSRLCS